MSLKLSHLTDNTSYALKLCTNAALRSSTPRKRRPRHIFEQYGGGGFVAGSGVDVKVKYTAAHLNTAMDQAIKNNDSHTKTHYNIRNLVKTAGRAKQALSMFIALKAGRAAAMNTYIWGQPLQPSMHCGISRDFTWTKIEKRAHGLFLELSSAGSLLK
jgi:hypothetical protein